MPADFHVFLSYHSTDRDDTFRLVDALERRSVRVWVDRDEISPGTQGYRKRIEDAVAKAPAAIIAIGPHGPGEWQEAEIDLCFSENRRRKLLLIPLLLPGARYEHIPPMLLSNFTISDFSDGFENSRAFDLLQWAITGDRLQPLGTEVGPVAPVLPQAAGNDLQLDTLAMTFVKATVYKAAEAAAEDAAAIIQCADTDADSELTRWIVVLTNLRWQRGYLKAFERLFRIRRTTRTIRDFAPALLCPDDAGFDGIVGSVAVPNGVFQVTIDGRPVANLTIADEADRALVQRSLAAYGRLGKPLAGAQPLLERLGDIPIQTVEQEESLLATLLYQNRGVLACLAARFGMPGQDLLLGQSHCSRNPVSLPDRSVARRVRQDRSQVCLTARGALRPESVTQNSGYRDYVNHIAENPDALKAIHAIFGEDPDAVRRSWEFARSMSSNR